MWRADNEEPSKKRKTVESKNDNLFEIINSPEEIVAILFNDNVFCWRKIVFSNRKNNVSQDEATNYYSLSNSSLCDNGAGFALESFHLSLQVFSVIKRDYPYKFVSFATVNTVIMLRVGAPMKRKYRRMLITSRRIQNELW